MQVDCVNQLFRRSCEQERLVSCFLTVASAALGLHLTSDDERGRGLVAEQQNRTQRVW